ncbi:MAG: metallophosphoesterase [Actinomycetota bacterium]
MFDVKQHLLSCWIIEAARGLVLNQRGDGQAAARAGARARLLASRCASSGMAIVPRYASAHAEWLADVAGSSDETGPVGWFFLQRIGAFVNAHLESILEPDEHARLVQLLAPDADEALRVLTSGAFQPIAPPPFPSASAIARSEGTLIAKIGIIGDLHMGSPGADTFAEAVVAAMNADDVQLSIVIGDLTQNGRAEFFDQVSTVLKGLNHACAPTLGNHDMWRRDGDGETGHARFQKAFGIKPFGEYFVNGVRAIVLDSSDPSISPFPPFDIISGGFTDQPPETVTSGTFSQESIEWMSRIQPDGPTFIFLHHPPHPFLAFPPLRFALDEISTGALSNLASRVEAAAIFCGHTHRSAVYELDGVVVIEVPCPKEWPFGHGILEVTEQGWSFNLRPVGKVPDGVDARYLLGPRYAVGPDEARAIARSFKT